MVYKGRKKKSIQYYAIKSVEKSQKPRVLQEVSCSTLILCTTIFMQAVSNFSGLVEQHERYLQVRTMHALEHYNILKFFAW